MGVALCTRTDLYLRVDLYLHTSEKMIGGAYLFSLVVSLPTSFLSLSDYYDHIKYPMDLKTMVERLKNGYYCHPRLFISDFNRVISNCRSYNNPDTEYYKLANTLEKYVHGKLRELGLMT